MLTKASYLRLFLEYYKTVLFTKGFIVGYGGLIQTIIYSTHFENSALKQLDLNSKGLILGKQTIKSAPVKSDCKKNEVDN